MAGIQGNVAESFREIEQMVFQRAMETGREWLSRVLELWDGDLEREREPGRYELKGVREREIETLVGPVVMKRRLYWDRVDRSWVFLLDEQLGLVARSRVSPGLEELTVLAAVEGPSYRGGMRTVEGAYGRPVVSHETARRRVIRTGEVIEADEARQQAKAQGRRKVPVIFLEADGLYVSLQRPNRAAEMRLLTMHEGWAERRPGSGEFQLVGRRHVVMGEGREAWEEASRSVYSQYDVAGSVVVINGDRAAWIRQGVQYFTDAAVVLYQFDPFHMVKDLRASLANQPEVQGKALAAYRDSRVEDLLTHLHAAYLAEEDEQKRVDIGGLLTDVEALPQAARDYRVRLGEKGYDTTGLRAMGAAEPQMDLFGDRVKGRGQSWSKGGTRAMLWALARHYEGRLASYVGLVLTHREEDVWRSVAQPAWEHLKKRLETDVLPASRGHMPAADRGLNATGGMSRLLREVSRPAASSI